MTRHAIRWGGLEGIEPVGIFGVLIALAVSPLLGLGLGFAFAALLLASGHLATLTVPLWVKLVCGGALTLGTSMGGWRIIRTVGRRIFRLASIDGFASQSASTAVILPASYIGAPVSTTQVVASSVIGVGAGRRRWRHVRWATVRSIAYAWLLTLPASAALGAIMLVLWKAVF